MEKDPRQNDPQDVIPQQIAPQRIVLQKIPSSRIEVIAPNLKRRLSGVTATIARLVPLQAERMGVVATGPGLPAHVPHISLQRAATLPRDRLRVWHARRNTEMLLGLVLRHVLRRRYRLLFTSASQREHSGYSRWLIARMDAVIATSARTAGYLKVPSTTILHGIDTERFAPALDKQALRTRLGLPEQGQLIGCYGRIRYQKGTDVFVDAMIAALPDLPAAAAVVMGRATDKHLDYLEGLKRRVAEAGLADRILFRPEVTVDRMPEWYQALDLFIAPQRWEGFGLTPIEAMSCGVPCVATTVGAFTELVQDGQSMGQDLSQSVGRSDGENFDPSELGTGTRTGQLIPPGDVQAMSTAARDLLRDPAVLAQASIAARNDMLARFRLEREAEEILAVYRQLLGQTATPTEPPSDAPAAATTSAMLGKTEKTG